MFKLLITIINVAALAYVLFMPQTIVINNHINGNTNICEYEEYSV